MLIQLRYRNAGCNSEFSCLHSGLDEDFILLQHLCWRSILLGHL